MQQHWQLAHIYSKLSIDEHSFHPEEIPKPGAERTTMAPSCIFLRNLIFNVLLPASQVPWASCVALKSRYRRANLPSSLLCSLQEHTALGTQRKQLWGVLWTPLCLPWARPRLSPPWGVLCALDSSLLSSTFYFPENPSLRPRSFPKWQLVTWEMNRCPGENDHWNIQCGR